MTSATTLFQSFMVQHWMREKSWEWPLLCSSRACVRSLRWFAFCILAMAADLGLWACHGPGAGASTSVPVQYLLLHLANARTVTWVPCAEKTGRGSLLNRPSCLSHNPVSQGTGLNWTQPLHLNKPLYALQGHDVSLPTWTTRQAACRSQATSPWSCWSRRRTPSTCSVRKPHPMPTPPHPQPMLLWGSLRSAREGLTQEHRSRCLAAWVPQGFWSRTFHDPATEVKRDISTFWDLSTPPPFHPQLFFVYRVYVLSS